MYEFYRLQFDTTIHIKSSTSRDFLCGTLILQNKEKVNIYIPGQTLHSQNMCKKCLKIYEKEIGIGKEKDMGHTYSHVSENDDCWEVEIETIEKCSKAPDKAYVYMAPLVKLKITALMKKFSHIEWFAYLVGKKINDNKDYLIENLLIPQQKVTGGSVTNVICPEFNKFPVIGALHSHHTMSNHFSGTDNEWVNQNHDVSLVVATDGIAGQVRWKTPCGGIVILPVKVLPYIDIAFDKEKFYQDELGKINDKAYSPTPAGVHVVHEITSVDNEPELHDEEDETLLTALKDAYPGIEDEETETANPKK